MPISILKNVTQTDLFLSLRQNTTQHHWLVAVRLLTAACVQPYSLPSTMVEALGVVSSITALIEVSTIVIKHLNA